MGPSPGRQSGAEWQAHAGAVGFGGLRAVTEPLREFPVKGFYLLEMPANDLARKWFSERKVNVEDRLKEAGAAHVSVWRAELWDPVAVARCIVQGMQSAGLETLHFNVSAGPNTVSVGATLAALYWDVRLYYAKANYDNPKERDTPDGPRIEGVHRLPPFRAHPPRAASLAALAILVEHGKDLQAGTWKQKLANEHGIIRHKGKDAPTKPMSAQAIHGQFEALIRPLLDLGLISEAWQYGQRSFRPTDQGRAFSRLFEGLPPSPDQEVEVDHGR